jgi:hypothetical protein
MLLGQLIHPRTEGKVIRRLRAAVKHYHKGNGPIIVATWNIELISSPTCAISVGALFELSAIRQRNRCAHEPVQNPRGAQLPGKVEEPASRDHAPG